jgi:hypothetical protein
VSVISTTMISRKPTQKGQVLGLQVGQIDKASQLWWNQTGELVAPDSPEQTVHFVNDGK